MPQGKWAPSIELEMALVNLVGPKYKRFADEGLDPETLRGALLEATDALERKLTEAGAGEGFRHRCGEGLELFRHEASKIWEEANNEWTLIARLLNLACLLLDYDWTTDTKRTPGLERWRKR